MRSARYDLFCMQGTCASRSFSISHWSGALGNEKDQHWFTLKNNHVQKAGAIWIIPYMSANKK